MKKLDDDLLKIMSKSVLCWLATTDAKGQPNVSPKEAFTAFEDKILIANIASPKSIRNIGHNNKVCVSFIEIFTQKGYQVYGSATLVQDGDKEYAEMKAPLLKLIGDKYPFKSLICIKVAKVHAVTAPSYFLFPEERASQKVEKAFRNYQSIYHEVKREVSND